MGLTEVIGLSVSRLDGYIRYDRGGKVLYTLLPLTCQVNQIFFLDNFNFMLA